MGSFDKLEQVGMFRTVSGLLCCVLPLKNRAPILAYVTLVARSPAPLSIPGGLVDLVDLVDVCFPLYS